MPRNAACKLFMLHSIALKISSSRHDQRKYLIDTQPDAVAARACHALMVEQPGDVLSALKVLRNDDILASFDQLKHKHPTNLEHSGQLTPGSSLLARFY